MRRHLDMDTFVLQDFYQADEVTVSAHEHHTIKPFAVKHHVYGNVDIEISLGRHLAFAALVHLGLLKLQVKPSIGKTRTTTPAKRTEGRTLTLLWLIVRHVGVSLYHGPGALVVPAQRLELNTTKTVVGNVFKIDVNASAHGLPRMVKDEKDEMGGLIDDP